MTARIARRIIDSTAFMALVILGGTYAGVIAFCVVVYTVMRAIAGIA
jgi:hypothetical protein